MNILLWIFQILLAIHTLTGAIWKFSNSEQSVPSLESISHALWLLMAIVELLCTIGLVIPAVIKKAGWLVPISALIITLEMLLFCVFHLTSGVADNSPMYYWLVVALFSGSVAYGRFKLMPYKKND